MRPRRQRGQKRKKLRRLQPPTVPTMGTENDPVTMRAAIVARAQTAERACDTKARFSQYAHAVKAERDIAARYQDGQRHTIYACAFCGGFHLARA